MVLKKVNYSTDTGEFISVKLNSLGDGKLSSGSRLLLRS
jgi:hypothetical protein